MSDGDKWSFCVACNAFVDVLALLCGEGRDGFGLVLVVCAAESGYFGVDNFLGKKGLLRTGM